MERIIDLNKSVYDICTKYPEVADVMKDQGFESIGTPGMLKTAGRFMTIPGGAQMKKIPLETIKSALREKGFTILGE